MAIVSPDLSEKAFSFYTSLETDLVEVSPNLIGDPNILFVSVSPSCGFSRVQGCILNLAFFFGDIVPHSILGIVLSLFLLFLKYGNFILSNVPPMVISAVNVLKFSFLFRFKILRPFYLISEGLQS